MTFGRLLLKDSKGIVAIFSYEQLRIDTSARESQTLQVLQEDAKQLKLRLGEVSRESCVRGVSVDVRWHRW